MSRCDITFAAMGSEVRLIIEDPRPDALDPAHAAVEAQGFIERFNAKLLEISPRLGALRAEREPASQGAGLEPAPGRRSRRYPRGGAEPRAR